MSIADKIVKRFDSLAGQRGVWESHWEEIAERILPRYTNSFFGGDTPGEKRTEKVFDSTASIALERFAAVMESMLTPRNSTWHKLGTDNEFLKKDRSVQLWFEQTTKTLFKHRYAGSANFSSQLHEVYLGLGAFGTAPLFIDANTSVPGLRYKAIHLSEMIFDENHQGLVDTAMRKFKLTARQIGQRWKDMELPDRVNSAIKEDPDKKFEIIHCVKPREDVNPERIDNQGMPWASYHVLVEDSFMLNESGYEVFPYATSRYTVAPGEVYGRSPAMTALPSIKTLNEQKKTMLKQGHRVVDPVILAHDDGILDGFAMKAGAIVNGGVSSEGRLLVNTLPTGNIAAGQSMMDMERGVINDVFLVSLFQILVDNPGMTATEVLERTREKGVLMAPTMGRQQTELLDPTISREIDLLDQQGLLPPLPPIMLEAEGEYDIQYDSPLSRSQRAEENAGSMRTLQLASEYAAQSGDQSVFDLFNADVIFRDIGAGSAMPMSHFRSQEEIAASRQQRQQQQQTDKMIEAAPAAAGMVKAVAQ